MWNPLGVENTLCKCYFWESGTVFGLNTFHVPEKSLTAMEEQTYVQIWQWTAGRIIKVSQHWSFSPLVKLKLNLRLV